MNQIQNLLFLTLFSLLAVSHAQAADYDIVIENGRVMDPESGFDAVANVGIRDGSIATITQDAIDGDRIIDATGLVVAPGFIDLHSHIGSIPFGAKLALRDGVTTPLEMELGAYPIDLFYDLLDGKSQVNYGATASIMSIREKALNPRYNSRLATLVLDSQIKDESMFFGIQTLTDKADAEQLKQIAEMMESELKRGALGIGNPVGYMTKGQTSQEMVEVQRLAGEYDRASFLHGRFSSQQPPTSGILATQEALASVGIYGGGLLVQHMHQQTLADTPYALQMLDFAVSQGLKVYAEIYPYNFGATIVGADYLVPSNYGPNMGRDYGDIIETATLKPLTKERYEELMSTDPTASVMFYGISEELMLDALAHPTTLIGSDAFPMTDSRDGSLAMDWGVPYDQVQGHPRAAGTHARVLRLVREKDLMPLMTAISKMSYMPAKFLEDNGVPAMATKGRVSAGADADIVLFDPDAVTDNATLKENGLPSTGIPMVLVNGVVVVEDSRVLEGIYPGQPIRNPIQE